jgi:hypothetical protein
MYVKWDDQILHNELLLAFKFKTVSKSLPVIFVVLIGLTVDRDPKTAPRMAPTMHIIVNKQIGMKNLFL